MAGDMAAGRFVGNPQPVEIHHRGIWYSGELLGWRHTPDGRVAARVRCTVDGLRHSTWKDLAELRLPDPAHPPRREPFPAPPARPLPAAAEHEDDRTRPHSLLAALTTRPRPPAHAVAPPAVPAAPDPVATALRPAAHRHRPSAPARPRPTPYRRTSPQADEWSRDWPDTRSRDERLSSV
ncbi:hypothetical protein [Blastococcus saxobsidens]|uniref:Uncharacterized protein n=1 Tax=Blastococcus saxobsidens (strain DD2) TaxID=1146883 RepID=H6RK08_BLASD|nr:hypothetical protein [Blastococcus saxobsidens]CCG04864.1 conserved protein of unknown function [Blastococcus saxobsidens DD2]